MSTPDRIAFEADVGRPAFRLGVAEGRWRLVDTDWPFAFLTVTARDGREYLLRMNCTNYPASPPTAGLWDRAANAPVSAEAWPPGRGGRFSAVFRRDWKGGTALYMPCDREAIAGHEHWVQQMPSKIWRPDAGVVQYLEEAHELLNCADYAPPARAAA